MEQKINYGLFIKKIVKTKKDGSEETKYSLIDQLLAAEKLEEIVKKDIAWDPVKMDWRMFKDGAWVDADESYAESKISEIIRGEIYSPNGRIGHSDSWWNGVVNLMKKSGVITRQKDKNGVIPFQNGLLDIKKIGEEDCLEEVNHENALSWCLPYDYNSLASCPNFLEWLRHSVDRDEDIINFLRAVMNVLVVGVYDLQFFLHIKGLAGTGKSTFVRLLKKMIGDHAAVSSSMERMRTNRFEYIRLYQKKLLIVNETPSRNDFRPLLEVTGRDPLVYELKGGNRSRDFEYEGVTILAGNSELIVPPRFSGAIARRIRVIEFNKQITKKQQVEWMKKGGEQKILHDEIPGIYQWILGMDAAEVERIITDPPESIRMANKKADVIGNGMSEWISECLLPVDPESVKKPVWTQIGSAQKAMRDGVTRYGTNPEEDEKTKLFPSYLAFCRYKGYQFPVTEDFANQVCITSNRIFGVDYIHRPMSKKDPSRLAKRNGTFGILNIRIMTDEELLGDDE